MSTIRILRRIFLEDVYWTLLCVSSLCTLILCTQTAVLMYQCIHWSIRQMFLYITAYRPIILTNIHNITTTLHKIVWEPKYKKKFRLQFVQLVQFNVHWTLSSSMSNIVLYYFFNIIFFFFFSFLGACSMFNIVSCLGSSSV